MLVGSAYVDQVKVSRFPAAAGVRSVSFGESAASGRGRRYRCRRR